MFGKKAKQIKEQAALIAQMEAKIEELTHQNERLTEKVDEYTAKEIMIARTLTDANVQAEKLVSEAQREAGNLLEESQLNVELARKDAENLVDDAYKNARDIVKAQKRKAQKNWRIRGSRSTLTWDSSTSMTRWFRRIFRERRRAQRHLRNSRKNCTRRFPRS